MSHRIIKRGGRFYLHEYNKRKGYNVPRATGIPCEIEQPKSVSENPDWWKKSKHRKELEQWLRVDELTRSLHGTRYAVQRPSYCPGWQELLEESNRERADDRDREFSPNTLERRGNSLAKFLEFDPDVTPLQVTKKTAKEYRAWLKEHVGSLWTARGYFNDLKSILAYAERAGYIEVNGFEGVQIKIQQFEGDPEPAQPVEIEDLKKVLGVAYLKRQPLFEHLITILTTGVRVDQTTRIERDRIDWQARSFRYWNSKSRRWEQVPIPDILYPFWREIPQYQDPKYLLAYRTIGTVNGYLHVACEIAGVKPFSSHALKDTFANLVAPACPDPRLYDMLMHHAPTVNVTAQKHYLKKDVDWMRQVLNEAFKPLEEFAATLPTLKDDGVQVRWARNPSGPPKPKPKDPSAKKRDVLTDAERSKRYRERHPDRVEEQRRRRERPE